MRTTLKLAVLASVLAATGVAHADVAGTYEVKYEEVSSNCTTTKLAYAPGPISVKVKANQLIVDIDRTPEMIGALPKNGKLSAKSKLGSTMIDGMKGVFSVAGRITAEDTLYLVMIGEYSANGKPLCTQTWNVSGAKQSAPTTPATPAKPAK
ncbi:MAG TPA: hypothetical protein VNO30_14365 [Kofleriaceae bacterium]|nr:hypothetical protein [Kofleriaceae bacterium]